MTTVTKQGNALFIGSKIVIPAPQEDDTWTEPMVTEVEDILDDGNIVFSDGDYCPHEIETSRVQFYQV